MRDRPPRGGRSNQTRVAASSLVERVLQALPRLELRLLRRRDVDLLAGARVPSFRRCALRNVESSDADETHHIVLLERFRTCVANAINGLGRSEGRRVGKALAVQF